MQNMSEIYVNKLYGYVTQSLTAPLMNPNPLLEAKLSEDMNRQVQPNKSKPSQAKALAEYARILSRGLSAGVFATILVYANLSALSESLKWSLYFLTAALPLNLFIFVQNKAFEDFGKDEMIDLRIGLLAMLSYVCSFLGFLCLFAHFGWAYSAIFVAALVVGELLTAPAIKRQQQNKEN